MSSGHKTILIKYKATKRKQFFSTKKKLYHRRKAAIEEQKEDIQICEISLKDVKQTHWCELNTFWYHVQYWKSRAVIPSIVTKDYDVNLNLYMTIFWQLMKKMMKSEKELKMHLTLTKLPCIDKRKIHWWNKSLLLWTPST